MQKRTNLNDVFDNLNNLKNAFKIGEKVVPIIQSLTEFMQETMPLLEQINRSIADSASQMPKASNQINDVTAATELATTEILDLVDEITNGVSEIETSLSNLMKKQENRSILFGKLKSFVADNNEAMVIVNQLEDSNNVSEIISGIKEKISKVSEDSYKITLSLQVQDITSQQLAAVNHLIESVNGRLQTLVEQINDSDLKSEFESLAIEVPESATYDPDAKYNHESDRQDGADNIFSNGNKEQASQDDIDKLFG